MSTNEHGTAPYSIIDLTKVIMKGQKTQLNLMSKIVRVKPRVRVASQTSRCDEG